MKAVTHTAASEMVTFTYDGDGRRVLRDTATETIAYVGPHYELRFDKLPMVEDLDDDCVVTVIDIMQVAAQWGAQGSGIPEDVNGDGTVDVGNVQQVAGQWRETCHVLAETVKYYALGGQRIAMRKAGTLYYLFGDHLGSTGVTYNTTTGQTQALRYYPWGGVRAGDVPTDRRFTGQRWDATIDLYDFQARYYDPALGRFVQPDTIVPEPGNPQDLNRYSYVRNNPQRYTDPSGHCAYDSSGVCVRYTDDGTPQVVRGGSVFVNPVEEAIANAILSGDPDRLLNAIPEGYNGAFLARTLEAVFKQLGYADAGTGVGDLVLDPFLVIGLASIGGDLAEDAIGLTKGGGVAAQWLGHVPARYRTSVAGAFEGTPEVVTLTEDLTVYRHWGGDARETGSPWFSPKPYIRPGNARRYLALPQENTARNVSAFRIPAGTTIIRGKVAPRIMEYGPHAVGRGMQIYLPHPEDAILLGPLNVVGK